MFSTVYTPLIPRLKATVQKHGRRVTEEPFVSFLKTILFTYLSNILGSSKEFKSLNRSVKCSPGGCNDCAPVERWVNDLNGSKEYHFKAGQSRRSHLERLLSAHSDLVTMRTVYSGNPHTLVVTKKVEMLERCTWKGRQRAAMEFLKLFGTDEELAGIVKERYGDVLKAIQGTQAFSVSSSAEKPDGLAVQYTGSASREQAGAKRKRRELPKNVVDVIDLT